MEESLGEDLPEIGGINLQWVDDSILVTWNPTDYLDFSSYSIYISSIEFNKINDAKTDVVKHRVNFEDLTQLYPESRFKLEQENNTKKTERVNK